MRRTLATAALATSTALAAPAGAQPAADNPYMTYKDRRESTIRVNIDITPFNGTISSPGEATLYFPAPKRTGSSLAHSNGIQARIYTNVGNGSVTCRARPRSNHSG